MITDIKFNCAHCGQRMVVEDSAAGLSTECPSCSASIVIPRRASRHDAAHSNGNGSPQRTQRLNPGVDADPDFATLRQELTDASVQITRLEGEVVEVETLKREKRKLRDELVRLKKELSTNDETLREAQAACAEAEARATTLADDLNRVEGEFSIEQEQTIRLRGEVDAYATERADVLPRLESAERAVEALGQVLREREAELRDTNATLASTQAARTEALREIQQLNEQLTTRGTELADARAVAARTETERRATAEELAATKKRLEDSQKNGKSLTKQVKELKRERDVLSKSLSQDTAGRDLVAAREELGVTTKERDRLSTTVERLSAEIESAQARQRTSEEDLRTALRELDEARRRAEAASETRLRRDNDVLRGIIARQNSELEQQHKQLFRLKRAQFGVRLAYAAFGIGLVLIALWAMRVVPGLKLGKLF